MLTHRKIEIFQSYKGDGDGFARCATQEEKETINYKDWTLIESLIQDISLIESGLASEQYKNTIVDKLKSAGIEYAKFNELVKHIKKV